MPGNQAIALGQQEPSYLSRSYSILNGCIHFLTPFICVFIDFFEGFVSSLWISIIDIKAVLKSFTCVSIMFKYSGPSGL